MKKVFLSLVLFVSMISAVIAGTPHQLVGGVIYVGIPSAPTMPVAIDYNTPMPSLEACKAAIATIKASGFEPKGQVTQGLSSEGDIDRAVNLQCVSKVTPTVQ